MRRSLRIWLRGFTPALALLPSCGDVSGPPNLGIYVLQEVNGEPLPVSWQPGDALTLTLVQDTLLLSEEGRFRRARIVRTADPDTGGTADLREEWEGSVLRKGGSWILLSDLCGSDSLVLCAPPPTVHPAGSGLIIRTVVPPGGELRYSPAG